MSQDKKLGGGGGGFKNDFFFASINQIFFHETPYYESYITVHEFQLGPML